MARRVPQAQGGAHLQRPPATGPPHEVWVKHSNQHTLHCCLKCHTGLQPCSLSSTWERSSKHSAQVRPQLEEMPTTKETPGQNRTIRSQATMPYKRKSKGSKIHRGDKDINTLTKHEKVLQGGREQWSAIHGGKNKKWASVTARWIQGWCLRWTIHHPDRCLMTK